MKQMPVSLSTPPNTHLPSTRFPRLYFLFPNLDSSISTVRPGPPKGSALCTIPSNVTSRQNDDQSTTVAVETSTNEAIWFNCTLFSQRSMKPSICHSFKWLPSKKVQCRYDCLALHFFAAFLSFLILPLHLQTNPSAVVASVCTTISESHPTHFLGIPTNFSSCAKDKMPASPSTACSLTIFVKLFAAIITKDK